MEVFRISKKIYSQLDGAGGLLYPGRWHKLGNRVIYAAQYRSLAALESLVHLSGTHLITNDFVITTLKIPDHIEFQTLKKQNLSANWNSLLNYSETQKIGADFLKSSKHLLLKVPSAILEDEYNFIINPLHPDFKFCKMISQKSFHFDNRFSKMTS